VKTNVTKKQMFADPRSSEEIDVSKEPDLYFMKLAYEYHGDATRDNSADQMVAIGMDIERGDEQ
jgi:hypothetical protein